LLFILQILETGGEEAVNGVVAVLIEPISEFIVEPIAKPAQLGWFSFYTGLNHGR